MNNTKGHAELLRPHLETITRLAQKYSNPDRSGRVQWDEALRAEPELANVLLVGDGTQRDQIKRLSMFWMRVKPRAQGQRTQQRNFKGQQSICSRFDDHRSALEEMARSNSNSLGRVSWVAALASNPDVAEAIGFTALDEEGRRKMVNVLGFWYRTRKQPGVRAEEVQVRRTAKSQVNGALPTPVQEPMPQPAARFCPRCGEDIGAHALASGLVASMSASGLSPTQIMQTLTQAANTVAKLSHD